jgi:histone deacetylase 1/2
MSDDEFPEMSPAPFTPTNKRVAYFYDQDVGNYVYYLGHPMKPHRIRMNDPLYGANGLNGHAGGSMDNSDEKYDKAVARGSRSTRMQCFRPRRANKNDMTRFHTDEYVELLEQVNPDNGESLTGGGMRCELYQPVSAQELTDRSDGGRLSTF